MMFAGRTQKKKPSAGSPKNSAPAVRVPHEYQWRGVEWNVGHGGSANFLKPGRGKTAIILRSILALKDNGKKPRVLVVSPLRVAHEVWPKEAAEWAGSEWARIAELKIRVLHGPRKNWEAEQDADIYVINVDGLKWLFEEGRYDRFRRMRLNTLVWDESTQIRHTRTKRFKLLKPTLKTFARRWIMTGSPLPRNYQDIFGQLYVVDLGKALGQFVTHFRFRFFTPRDKFGWEWDLKPGAEKEIQAAIAPYVFQLTEKEESVHADEPELAPPNVVRVDLPREARRVYDELEEDLITELKKGGAVVTAVSSGVAAMKCAQVCNGGIYLAPEPGRPREWKDVHEAKLEAVEELVSEMGGRPCLIVYDFEHDLARLRKLFPKAPHIGGGVSAKVSGQIIDDWNADRVPVLLVQPATVSHGLNMQKSQCTDIIWHSLTYDYEIFEQLCKRVARQGSRQARIFCHLIVCRDTVDEAKLRALKRKERAQAGFLDALREYAKTREK